MIKKEDKELLKIVEEIIEKFFNNYSYDEVIFNLNQDFQKMKNNNPSFRKYYKIIKKVRKHLNL
jgi:hypothetical protein